MKIYILPIPAKLQPAHIALIYPRHNRDYGVEQDFLQFLHIHPQYVTRSPEQADWHYLPVFWSRWHSAHEYGETGRDELHEAVMGCVRDDKRTFTVCGYGAGTRIDTGRTTIFQVSRRDDQSIDIPLLSWRHRRPLIAPAKKYTASFIGRVSTHPIRQAMFDALKDRRDVMLYEGEDKDSAAYVRAMLEAWVALCPRGFGGSSFRLYEALELGVVPFFIGEPDTRPFRRFIDWNAFSLFAPTADQVSAQLEAHSPSDWKAMGQRAAQVYQQSLRYQKWCVYALKELEQR